MMDDPTSPTPAQPLPTPDDGPHTAKKAGHELLSVLGMVAGALLLAVFLVAFIFQSYRVDGESMHNTLQHNDRLIIWKAGHTLNRLTGKTEAPKRGDIVVFHTPQGVEGVTPGKQLIKRVIALPGERVSYQDGTLTVYNKEHPDGFNPDKDLPYGSKVVNNRGNDVNATVGDGQVYVLGDNRDNSTDSRVFGPLDTHNLVGKLALRLLPFSSFETF